MSLAYAKPVLGIGHLGAIDPETTKGHRVLGRLDLKAGQLALAKGIWVLLARCKAATTCASVLPIGQVPLGTYTISIPSVGRLHVSP